MPQFKPEGYQANVALKELVRKYAEEKSATLAQIFLAWMLAKKPYIVSIPGSRKIDCLRENAGTADLTLTAEEVGMIDAALDGMKLAVFDGTL